MSIDWGSLLLVTIVTVGSAGLVSAVMSLGARMLDHAHMRIGKTGNPGAARGERVAGYGMIVLVGLMVLYGLYLVIPFFHQ